MEYCREVCGIRMEITMCTGYVVCRLTSKIPNNHDHENVLK